MDFRNSFFIKGVAALVFVGAMLLSACGMQDPAAQIASAKEFIGKKEYAAASIQLKNALQRQESAEVRYLLATTLIELGELNAAELHLRRALESGSSPEIVYPVLARVLADLGEFKKLTAELKGVKLGDAGANAVVLSAVGEAYFALGQADNAGKAFAAALASNPKELRARIGEARRIARQGEISAAMAEVDDVLAHMPNQPPALALKAALLMSQDKNEEAAEVLLTLVKVSPFDGHARFALISLLIATGKLDLAVNGIAAMKKDLPRDVRARYLEAVLAFRKAHPVGA